MKEEHTVDCIANSSTSGPSDVAGALEDATCEVSELRQSLDCDEGQR